MVVGFFWAGCARDSARREGRKQRETEWEKAREKIRERERTRQENRETENGRNNEIERGAGRVRARHTERERDRGKLAACRCVTCFIDITHPRVCRDSYKGVTGQIHMCALYVHCNTLQHTSCNQMWDHTWDMIQWLCHIYAAYEITMHVSMWVQVWWFEGILNFYFFWKLKTDTNLCATETAMHDCNHIATRCNTLYHSPGCGWSAMLCVYTLQHTATHFSTLQ